MSLKNPATPPGIDRGTVRLVAQRLNHYATPGPTCHIRYKKKAHRILVGTAPGKRPLDKVLNPDCVKLPLQGSPLVFDIKLDPEDEHHLHGTLRTEHKLY